MPERPVQSVAMSQLTGYKQTTVTLLSDDHSCLLLKSPEHVGGPVRQTNVAQMPHGEGSLERDHTKLRPPYLTPPYLR